MNTVVMKLSSVEMETEEEEEDKLGHRVGFHQLNIGGDHLLAQFFNVDFSLPSEFGLGLRRVAEQGFDFRRTVIFLVDFDTDDSCLLVLADFIDSFSFPAEKRSGLFHRTVYMIEYERPLGLEFWHSSERSPKIATISSGCLSRETGQNSIPATAEWFL